MPAPPPGRGPRDPREEEMMRQQMAASQPIPGQSPPPGAAPPPGMPSGGMPPDEMMGDELPPGQSPMGEPGGMPGSSPMDQGGPPGGPGGMPGGPGMGAGGPVEPYSVQLWRRVHGDINDLLAEYDQLLQPLEHEPSKGLMVHLLQHKAQRLSEIEQHWNSVPEYKHFPPLDGAMIAYDDAEMGEGVDPHTGEPVNSKDSPTVREPDEGSASPVPQKEEVPAEEAAVGMGLPNARSKKKEKKSGKKGEKSLTAVLNKAAKKDDEEDESEEEEKPKKPKKKEEDDEEGGEESGEEEGDEDGEDSEEGDGGEVGEGNEVEMTDGNVPTPPDVPHPHSLPETLKDHELSAVVNTGEFLKGVATPNSAWDEESRFMAFFHGKTLTNIGSVLDTGSLGGDAEAVPGDEEHKDLKKKEKGIEPTPMEGAPPQGPHNAHRKMCKDCGSFLHDLAKQAVIGDHHRFKAMDWHKQLGGMGGGPEPGAINPNLSGEMGDKSVTLKFLKVASEEQNRVLETLSNTVDGLAKHLKKKA